MTLQIYVWSCPYRHQEGTTSFLCKTKVVTAYLSLLVNICLVMISNHGYIWLC